MQLSSLAADQQLYNLQKECEEKDATIKELAAAAHASSTADAKVNTTSMLANTVGNMLVLALTFFLFACRGLQSCRKILKGKIWLFRN
jgi:hypothetical protein